MIFDGRQNLLYFLRVALFFQESAEYRRARVRSRVTITRKNRDYSTNRANKHWTHGELRSERDRAMSEARRRKLELAGYDLMKQIHDSNYRLPVDSARYYRDDAVRRARDINLVLVALLILEGTQVVRYKKLSFWGLAA